MNELSILFNKLDIDFSKVLKAANTKWNFLNFKPGLVGGHCIGVDPTIYRLKQKQRSSKLKLFFLDENSMIKCTNILRKNL